MPDYNPGDPRRIPKIEDWVAYTLARGKSPGQIRYGFVVAVHSPDNINIVIHTNGTDDFEEGLPGSEGILWVENVLYSDDYSVKRTWHWPKE